jgi:hypothetical protein
MKEFDKIVCTNSETISLEPLNGDEKFYKKTIMEYGGETLTLDEWTIEKCKESFESLLLPIACMNTKGFYHNDLHQNNIIYNTRSKKFVLIDYGEMKYHATFSNRDFMSLLNFMTPGCMKVFRRPYYEKRYPKNYEKKASEIIHTKFDHPLKKDFIKNLVYMTVYYPDIYVKILFNTNIIPKDIEDRVYSREKCMEIFDIIENIKDQMKIVKLINKII